MNIDSILKRIRDNSSLSCRGGMSEAGPTVEIKIPNGNNRYIVGLAPIDNESDERFADYLISEAWKENEATKSKDG